MLFAQGNVQESVSWFSKALWRVENAKVAGISEQLHSILYSNRAFAHIKLRNFEAAESDCSSALAVNCSNRKARYRRAQARFGLGLAHDALEDVHEVLRELTDVQSRAEAEELKRQILEKLEVEKEQAVASKRGHHQETKELPANQDDPFPDVQTKHTKEGLEDTKQRGNKLFQQGDFETASRHFSKCIWLANSGYINDASGDTVWKDGTLAALYNNRAFAHFKCDRWKDAEGDCTSSLALRPQSAKALYRRALVREKLGLTAEALEDAKAALLLQHDQELHALVERLSDGANSGVGGQASVSPVVQPEQRPQADAPNQSSAVSAKASQSARGTRSTAGESSIRSMASPSIPASSPKNSFELLRNFNSFKRHPAVLASYVRERVPPALVQSLFNRVPIEPDDLAILLSALQINMREAKMGSDKVAEYLRQLLRCKSADTQISMLSGSEREVLQDLAQVLPPSDAVRTVLQRCLG
jgi:tetratricopeptide (TPR) repeat protein